MLLKNQPILALKVEITKFLPLSCPAYILVYIKGQIVQVYSVRITVHIRTYEVNQATFQSFGYQHGFFHTILFDLGVV